MSITNKLLKETTSMAIYRHLYDSILSGYFQPGEWIRERQIKELLGVSSTPIREALKMLVQERILESVPHHGVRVKKLSLKEIEDVYELRAEMEGLAASLAALRGTNVHFNRMYDILSSTEINLRVSNENQDSQFFKDNNDFHDLIVEAGNNHALKNALFQLRPGVNLIRMMSWKSNKHRLSDTLDQHRLIFDAIVARDSELARKQTIEHVWDSVKLVRQSVKAGQD